MSKPRKGFRPSGEYRFKDGVLTAQGVRANDPNDASAVQAARELSAWWPAPGWEKGGAQAVSGDEAGEPAIHPSTPQGRGARAFQYKGVTYPQTYWVVYVNANTGGIDYDLSDMFSVFKTKDGYIVLNNDPGDQTDEAAWQEGLLTPIPWKDLYNAITALGAVPVYQYYQETGKLGPNYIIRLEDARGRYAMAANTTPFSKLLEGHILTRKRRRANRAKIEESRSLDPGHDEDEEGLSIDDSRLRDYQIPGDHKEGLDDL